MALNSSATVMTLHSEQRVMSPSKMTLLLCWCKFFDDNTVDDFVSFVERSSVDVKNLLCSLNAAGKGADITHRRMTCSLLFFCELCLLQIPQQERGDTTKFVELFCGNHFHHFYLLVIKNGFPHFLKSMHFNVPRYICHNLHWIFSVYPLCNINFF